MYAVISVYDDDGKVVCSNVKVEPTMVEHINDATTYKFNFNTKVTYQEAKKSTTYRDALIQQVRRNDY